MVRDLLVSKDRGFPVGQVMSWQTGAESGMKQIGAEVKAINQKSMMFLVKWSDDIQVSGEVVYDWPSGGARATIGDTVKGWRSLLANTPRRLQRLDDLCQAQVVQS